MVCEQCGNLIKDGALVCEQCGAQILAQRRDQGTAGRRQGRQDNARTERMGSAMDWAQPPSSPYAGYTASPRRGDAGRPDARRGTPPPPTTGEKMNREPRKKTHAVHKMMINWALVWTIVAFLVVVAIGACLVFLKVTDAGQLIMVRMGKEGNALAHWTYGTELFDQGYVDKAIAHFETAYEMEPDREDIYDRLLILADAYEAGSKPDKAEEIFTLLYTEIDPKNITAYRSIVRLMQDQNRLMELSSFLTLAYENTGDDSFRRERTNLLPSTPTTTKEAGKLRREQDIGLVSDEDYDIYYILGDEGVLPEDGQLYTAPIHLGKGAHVIRAVAVSSDLISDELRVTFTIELPVPYAPLSSLAPDTYKTRQRIWLRYEEKEEDKKDTVEDPKEDDITIYYTLDGQTPTSNSPIYTGEPFYLPGGKVVLKAVAVNGYGEVSNVLTREYKINIPFERFFREGDEFSDFTLLKTSRDAFVKKYGSPLEETEIEDATMLGSCIKLSYPWGEARFVIGETGYVLYHIETSSTSMTGPRKTKVGMSETDVTEKFRDMGQTYNQNGDRSIYFDQDAGYAMLYHLGSKSDRIDYVYYKVDTTRMILSYHLEDSKVVKITMRNSYTE
ncbi:MAG: hypothetical protein E7324_04635 [Clostridiales bacterium]|nr:hypothetical protein [Clostridiales bacterium]